MKKKIGKRVLSLLVCLALVVSCLPLGMWTGIGGAQAATVMLETDRKTDPSTLDQWKKYFGVQTGHPQNVVLSTEFAGGVWTDKSVFAPGSIPTELTDAKYNGNSFVMEDKGDNFLVSLSAIASNKQIKGYSTIPTDTVLILDLSSSMRYTGTNNSSAVDELVTATNKAITQLQELNVNNRVAVVAYAGTNNASWSARDGKDVNNETFTFNLYETGSDFATKDITPITTQNSGKTFAFPAKEYTIVDTWYYVVTETNGGEIIDGMAYDATRYLITVTTTDNGKGGLDLTTDIKVEKNGTVAAAEKIAFSNEYALREPATFTPEAIKRYERPEDEQLRAFTFTLTGEGENQMKKNSTVDGKVVFDTLTFHEAKTYTYTITEVPDKDLDFIKWDTNVYTLTVVTVDGGKGQVAIESVTATSIKGTNDLEFVNAHEDLILKKDVYLESEPTVSIDGKVVEVGDVLTYAITYTNYNNQPADVVITDQVPQYTAFLSADNGGSFADGIITWELKDIAAGDSVTVTFQVKVTGGVDQKISNRATVLDAENTYASNEVVNPVEEDTVSKDVFLAEDPKISIDGKQVTNGTVLLYTITYTNADSQKAAVTILDTIPQHTSYVKDSADHQGVYENGVITWTLELAPGESKTVSFCVKVNDYGATVTNQAVAYEGTNQLETNEVAIESEPEPKPEPETPDTGDGMQMILWIGLMVCSAMALAAGVIFRRKVME